MTIIEYLERKGVSYNLKGKNVRKNTLAIKCPFCQDAGKHLNISLTNGYSKCWRCGEKQLSWIIRDIEGCNGVKAYLITKSIKFDKSLALQYQSDQQPKPFYDILQNKYFLDDLPEPHVKYLEKRGFDAYHLQSQYQIKACYNFGDYKYRIIIPIFQEGKLVSFTSRDITGKAELKYRLLPDKESLVPRQNLVYNIDNVIDGKVVVVEGPFDTWRIGRGSVSMLTIQFTKEQILSLVRKNVKRFFVLFDSEERAQAKAEELGIWLSMFGKGLCSEVICLCNGYKDPAEMTEEDARRFRKEVL